MTDAAASDEVTPIEVPDAANVPATYAGVVVGKSPNQDAASAFLDWLTGPEGQADAVLVRVPAAAMTSGADSGASTRVAGRGRPRDLAAGRTCP